MSKHLLISTLVLGLFLICATSLSFAKSPYSEQYPPGQSWQNDRLGHQQIRQQSQQHQARYNMEQQMDSQRDSLRNDMQQRMEERSDTFR